MGVDGHIVAFVGSRIFQYISLVDKSNAEVMQEKWVFQQVLDESGEVAGCCGVAAM